MLEVKLVKDRLMMISLQTDKRTVVIVSAYSPKRGLTNDEKDRFYESIVQLISAINEKCKRSGRM